MTNREWIPWLLLGLLLGFLLALHLSQHDTPPEPPPCADEKEPPLDFVEPMRGAG